MAQETSAEKRKKNKGKNPFSLFGAKDRLKARERQRDIDLSNTGTPEQKRALSRKRNEEARKRNK